MSRATQTHYTFVCGGVDLRLTFTATLHAQELELISRPVNYITYTVTSNDGKDHETELYLEASPRWALDYPYQESVAERFGQDGLLFVKAGSKEQNILAKKGDDLRIDWGYFLLATDDDPTTTTAIGTSEELRRAFIEGSPAPEAVTGENEQATMAIYRDLGTTRKAHGKWLIGYDDIYSIQYFGENLRPYWNADGTHSIVDEFRAANEQYDEHDRPLLRLRSGVDGAATAAGGNGVCRAVRPGLPPDVRRPQAGQGSRRRAALPLEGEQQRRFDRNGRHLLPHVAHLPLLQPGAAHGHHEPHLRLQPKADAEQALPGPRRGNLPAGQRPEPMVATCPSRREATC